MPTNAEINAFVTDVLARSISDREKAQIIAAAAVEYGVSNAQIAQATGYDQATVDAYLAPAQVAQDLLTTLQNNYLLTKPQALLLLSELTPYGIPIDSAEGASRIAYVKSLNDAQALATVAFRPGYLNVDVLDRYRQLAQESALEATIYLAEQLGISGPFSTGRIGNATIAVEIVGKENGSTVTETTFTPIGTGSLEDAVSQAKQSGAVTVTGVITADSDAFKMVNEATAKLSNFQRINENAGFSPTGEDVANAAAVFIENPDSNTLDVVAVYQAGELPKTIVSDVSRGIDAVDIVTEPVKPSDMVKPVEPVLRYVFGDITLPQGWYQFTPAQKADWFNQNNVTPTRLRAAGVPDQDIIYLRQAGYTIQDAITVAPVSPVAPAAGNLLPLALAAAFVLFGG